LGGFVKEVWGKGLEEVKNQESEMINAHCQKKDMQFHFHAKKNLFAFMLLLTSWPTN
jgi:hypothetical protein